MPKLGSHEGHFCTRPRIILTRRCVLRNLDPAAEGPHGHQGQVGGIASLRDRSQREGVHVARLPESLNFSAAGRVRLALPTARLTIIAFSFTLAAVGMGAFVATLSSASAVGTRSSLPASPPAAAAAWARSLSLPTHTARSSR